MGDRVPRGTTAPCESGLQVMPRSEDGWCVAIEAFGVSFRKLGRVGYAEPGEALWLLGRMGIPSGLPVATHAHHPDARCR
jgi:hypothetical protein